METHSAGGPGQGCGDGEEPVAESFGFPAAGVGAVQGEELQPGGEVDGESDDGAPELVLSEAVQREEVAVSSGARLTGRGCQKGSLVVRF